MKALQLSAASIALACALSAQADEITVAAADIQRTAAPGEFRIQGSLLSQAKAVLATVRQRSESQSDRLDVLVVDVGDRVAAADATGGNCQRMPIPGSRIREMRCYNPSPGEAALNQYQFQEEMRQIRDSQAMRVMQQSQYERVVLEAPTQPPTGNR